MKRKLNIFLNAPITISYCTICVIVLFLQFITNGFTTDLLFSTYSSSFFNPLTYIRLIGHIFGHVNITHLMNNLMYLLLLGPMLEEKYHNKLIYIILSSAIVTGLVNNIFFPYSKILGASGVVFTFILLSSITGENKGIPITSILVSILYVGNEIINMFVLVDNVSQITHIIGGIVGLIIGMYLKNIKIDNQNTNI